MMDRIYRKINIGFNILLFLIFLVSFTFCVFNEYILGDLNPISIVCVIISSLAPFFFVGFHKFWRLYKR